MAVLKLTETKELEFNNKPIEKIIREVKVYKNEDKRKYRKVIKTKNTCHYSEDGNSIPNLNLKNRVWDDWGDNPDVLKKRFPLFLDFVVGNRINYLSTGKPYDRN